MKKFSVIIAVVIAGLALLSFSALAEDIEAQVTGISGDVMVRQSADADWQAAEEGAMIPAGGGIKTGSDGEATLVWGDGNALMVSALSMITIDELSLEASGKSSSQLSMEHGKVMAMADKLKDTGSSFNITTPVAVAGVRGSAFECNLPQDAPNDLSVAVVEGEITVEAGGVEVTVTIGFEVTVAMGAPPSEPMAIPPARLNSLKSVANQLRRMAKAEIKSAIKEQKKQEKEEKKEESAAAPGGEVSDEVTEQVTDTVMDEVVEQTTIQDEISETATEGTGGSLSGEISFY